MLCVNPLTLLLFDIFSCIRNIYYLNVFKLIFRLLNDIYTRIGKSWPFKYIAYIYIKLITAEMLQSQNTNKISHYGRKTDGPNET